MKTIFRLSILAFFLGISNCLQSASTPPAKPNLLFIISDDHGWADYGFMGHPHFPTPNLDRLAASGLAFQRGYSIVPLCRPSLATIITGLYPHQHGVTGNDPALPEKDVNAMTRRGDPKYARYYSAIIESFHRQPNFVRGLVDQGYLAMETGKWWEGDPIKTAGFTHAMTQGDTAGSRHGDAGLEIGRKGLASVFSFIEQAGKRPWMVWYAPMLPHAPHTPPQDLLEKYLKVAPSEPVARYWACVDWFDRSCGELLDYLDKHNMRSNTLVIYTADNGWIQNPEVRDRAAAKSKLTPYEGGIRTPIIVSWPGQITPRLDGVHLAGNIDLWPTLAALMRVPCPAGLPGINLTDAKAVSRRTRIFGEQYAHNIADVDVPTRSLEHRWMIEGWHKLIVPNPETRPTEKAELYDLRQDPRELNDLAELEAGRMRRLHRQLDAWWQPTAHNQPGSTLARADSSAQEIDAATLERWSQKFLGWHYWPDHVIPAEPKVPGFEHFQSTDVPCVFQLPKQKDKWFMSYIAFNGQGYNSFVVESTNLVHWTNPRLAMGFGPINEFDHGGCVIGAFLYESYDLQAARMLKKRRGQYWTLYGCYPRQGGYELRPGYEGVACSNDGLFWCRAKNSPILAVQDPDCGAWEKDCIYQPWLVEYRGGFYDFYNAAQGGQEQMGLALSNTLLDWKRHEGNPIVRNRAGGYDANFCSDGKVFRDGDHWVMLYFGVGRGGAHIMAAFSRDLKHWTARAEPLYKAGGHPSGLDKQYAHKISLVFNPKNRTYYLYYCAVGSKGRGIGLLTSNLIRP